MTNMSAVAQGSTMLTQTASHWKSGLPDFQVFKCHKSGVPDLWGQARWLKRASKRLDLHHARDGFDGAGDLRGHLEAARQFHFDLGTLLEQQNDAHLAITIRLGRPRNRFQPLCHGLERRAVAQEYAQPLLQIGGGIIERFRRLDARAYL